VSEQPRRLVVGVGNPDRGDDGAGWLVASLLAGRLPEDVRIEKQLGGAAELIGLFGEADCVVMIDAMVSGAPGGTIRRLDCVAGNVVPERGGASSHGFGVALAVALAGPLSCLPKTCVVYAIEAADFALGAQISAEVETSAREVARRIVRELTG
jgi:hydrogenase maturation protease